MAICVAYEMRVYVRARPNPFAFPTFDIAPNRGHAMLETTAALVKTTALAGAPASTATTLNEVAGVAVAAKGTITVTLP